MNSFKKLITSEPVMLLYEGDIPEENLRNERITLGEIYMAARKEGIAVLKDIDVMVMETSSDITVIKSIGTGAEVMSDVKLKQ